MALDYKSSLARYRRYVQLVSERPVLQASMFVIFSLGLMIVLLILALRPTLITIAGLVGEIRLHRDLSLQLNEKILKLQEAGLQLSQQEGRLVLLDEAVPSEPAWSGFGAKLSEIASESGVALSTIAIGPVQVRGKNQATAELKNNDEGESTLPNGVGGISFSVTASGEYEQMKQFLTTLENLKRIVLLSDVTVARDESGLLTLSATGTIGYAQKGN